MNCAKCDERGCYLEGKDCTGGRYDAEALYDEEDLEALRVSTGIEGEFYMELTRVEELVEYARRMKYSKIGLAFCIGLAAEAQLLQQLLSRDFKVTSVCCKITGEDKAQHGLRQVDPNRYEAMCNPIVQANVLNREKTELNVIVGLCIGHDILFNKHSEAPVTTIAVKDRVLAHNPLGALYSRYYLSKKFKL